MDNVEFLHRGLYVIKGGKREPFSTEPAPFDGDDLMPRYRSPVDAVTHLPPCRGTASISDDDPGPEAA